MIFGPVPTRDAVGCILAHSTKLPSATYKKGRVLDAQDVAALTAAGVEEIVVAQLSPDDVGEDVAAERIAAACNGGHLSSDTPFTGRVNLHAEATGLLIVDASAINQMNRIDPAITIATLPAYEKVAEGRMVATAKIIPFAVPGDLIAQAEATIRGGLRIAPFGSRKIGLVATKLDHLKPATMDKTRRVLEQRLSASNSQIVGEERVAHTPEAVAEAMNRLQAGGADLLVLFGASAVVDRQDVLPRAIEVAGGRVTYFGMPVDPGNLLLLGNYQSVPVIGAPGCARSPKENGFDWVLDRLLAGIEVRSEDISGLGVGGLLMEIGSRPQPREKTEHSKSPKVGAIVLAAGKSSRMGPRNKLLETVDGMPLVAHAAGAASRAGIDQTAVITGHMADAIAECLDEMDVTLVHNPDYADGMAGSIRAGVAALGPDIDAAIILLGDMPGINAQIIQNMIAAYTDDPSTLIVAASASGKRGNPVLWDKRFFPDLMKLHGDIGARHIIAENGHLLREIDIGDAARIDLDTPEALASYREASDLANKS
ncbi:molybdopterin-binding/glycosyltransferase family 2 protein [Roseibium polysiphoniae]|uniref:molybdopterin-binding/glycosyltransferase family 2 protein n=1 Tax=Roseibium polysiphoniae TaxID=2571221 RepID=UPI00329A017F